MSVVSGNKINKMEFKHFANKYVGMFIADKIGRNFEVLLKTVLCTLGLLYKMTTAVPNGHIL